MARFMRAIQFEAAAGRKEKLDGPDEPGHDG
jgi:hypothetical protein